MSIEAMKQALEALESAQMSNYGRDWVWPDTAHPTAMAMVREAITALRQAIEQAEQAQASIHPISGRTADELWLETGRLRAELAELKAEQAQPVAWRTFDGEGGYDYRDYHMNEDYAQEWAKRNPLHVGWVEPLYTAPPQRKPLTDEEKHSLVEWAHPDIIEAIELKLRERNT